MKTGLKRGRLVHNDSRDRYDQTGVSPVLQVLFLVLVDYGLKHTAVIWNFPYPAPVESVLPIRMIPDSEKPERKPGDQEVAALTTYNPILTRGKADLPSLFRCQGLTNEA